MTYSDSVTVALGYLRSYGRRVTRERRAVIEALAEVTGHPTAEEICAVIDDSHPAIHRSTIYRTLETLATLGIVTHIHFGGGATRYHLVRGAGPTHLHASCTSCGQVEDLAIDLLDEAARRLRDEMGFRLDPGHMALLGRCADCLEGQGLD